MDNTVGSLTEKQKSIIIGKVLGDGTLRKERKNALFEVNHSWKQKEYVFWIYEHLKNMVSTPPRIRKSGENRRSCRFTTRSLSFLTSLYNQFYIESVKRIPTLLKFDPLLLAVWFMDDGSKSRNTVYFNTQQFSHFDQMILVEKLKEIGLEATLNKDKSYYRLRLRTSSMPRFKFLIEPHVIKPMQYKIP